MIPQFSGLSESEIDLMYDAIPLITIYIAGADGNIDKEEKEWAEKITKIRSYSYHETLQQFYTNVGERYSNKLAIYLASLPKDTAMRTVAIREKLINLNDILPKLDQNFAGRYYKGLLTFAEHVAKASGGFLGFASISREEKQLIGLSMINPIEFEEEEAEEGQDENEES